MARELRESHSVERSLPLIPDGDTPVDGLCCHFHPLMDLLEWFEVDDLLTLVMDCVAPRSWEADGVWAEVTPAFIVSFTRRDVQLDIESMLADLVGFVESLDGPPTFEPRPAEIAWMRSLAMLEDERIAIGVTREDGLSLAEVADALAKVSYFDFRVGPEVTEELEPSDLLLRLPAESTSVRSILDQIERQLPSIAWSIANEAVVLHVEGYGVAHAADLRSTEFYDIRAVLKGTVVPMLNADPDQSELEEPLLLGPSMLEEYLRNTIGGDTWENDPSFSMRVTERGLLIVAQSQEVHRDLRRELKKLSRIRATIDSVSTR